MKFIPLSAAALLSLSMVAAESPPATSPPEPEPKSANLAVEANGRFAFDLYRQLAEESEGENLFFSPYSVSSALAMTTEGARGDTAMEMGKVLGYPEALRKADDDIPWAMKPIHEGMSALNDRFNGEKDPDAVAAMKAQIQELKDKKAEFEKSVEAARASRDFKKLGELNSSARKVNAELNKLLGQVDQYELKVANALWGEQTYPFKEDYFDKISEYYKTGGVFEVDFVSSAEEVRGRINSWVEEMTNERIKDLIPPGAVDGLTRLVLVNAIYFKGEWTVPFEEKSTNDLDFHFADGSKEKRPTMHANGLDVAKYAAFNADGAPFATPFQIRPGGGDAKTYPDEDGFLMLELPYKGDELSMVVIAPLKPENLSAVESKFSAENFAKWIGTLKQRKVHVYLPKFKSETEYTLGSSDEPGALQKLGMVRAFTDPRAPEGAVFDGMSHAKSPGDKLYITKVLHKAFIEVNEKGTEAAAATGVVMAQPTSVRVTVPFTPTFKADRPFVYLIRDRETGSILFMGRTMNPES